MGDPRSSLSRTSAQLLKAPEELETLTWHGAEALLRRQQGMSDYLPDGTHAIDPRGGVVSVFNRKRARRPHDNRPRAKRGSSESCVICAGQTTSIIDIADLSDGFTFINENLYPVFHPSGTAGTASGFPSGGGGPSYGLHFVQWTSSYHDTDWPDLSGADRVIVLDRLAALERCLLELKGFPGPSRHVSIIKNVGHQVGGSMSHPHQQIALSSTVPRRIQEDQLFREREGVTFAEHMLARNPRELMVREFDTGRLLVPYYMRRPYDLLYVLANPARRYLYETDGRERADLGTVLVLGMQLLRRTLKGLGREPAFNIVFHTGFGAGLYLEFLPRSQEEGGFEKLGLSACQSSPSEAAGSLRELL